MHDRTNRLKQAIDANDFEQICALMSQSPELHQAPLGYGKNGPLTWVAECRVPWEPPSAVRLAIAEWMIVNGSDVHQGGDGPLMRAALNRDRIRMMELLVRHGADVNAKWNGNFPILFAACEAVCPVTLEWLLQHGADPNCGALDYAIGAYVRSPELGQCIDLLVAAGATTKYDLPGVLDILCGRTEPLTVLLDGDPALLHHRFPELDFGTTGGRLLTLQGATLLHVAAEYGNLAAASLLLDRGADVNAKAALWGQTPIFHAATQFWDCGLPMVRLLLDRGADVNVTAKVPGHYERPGEMVECTPAGYAARFPETPCQTAALLQESSKTN